MTRTRKPPRKKRRKPLYGKKTFGEREGGIFSPVPVDRKISRWKGKVAVVTGASAGIGAAISKRLVEAGLIVVGLARRKEKIEKLSRSLKEHGGKLISVKVDITVENDVIQAFKWIKDNLGPVCILINNAGILRFTTLVDGDAQMWREVFETNVFGLCVATREACRNMNINNVNGHIVHINSFTGHRVIHYPNSNVYSASKFAITALAETLRQELNYTGSKIKITSISPAGVATEMAQIGLEASKINHVQKRSTEEFIGLGPEDVADAVMYALSTPPHVQIYELKLHAVNEPF
ncbi:hypothetical protein RN001_013610 [Aquatica leii]|uniref:Dehydrogenase/reductase SDR family member 11 n=1 Tax=Aquatica leii TaxID=1421715 RepID=A0AAN7PZZ9_9COLE|nr:hypothetical protein RN001_013610 [Aquatica leii]